MISPITAYWVSGILALLFLVGMILEYRRISRPPEVGGAKSVFLERFPSDLGREVTPSGLFKLFVLLFPAPVLFLLLVLIGYRRAADIWPVFFFSWGVVMGAIYLIFFADFSGFGGLGGFGRPRPPV